MPQIVEPVSFEKEERLTIANDPGKVCVAVSGYANFFNLFDPDDGEPVATVAVDHNLVGDIDDDDALWIPYKVHLIVGPKFTDVRDVSPIVFVAGFTFGDPDSANADGIHIDHCTWDTVGFEEETPEFEKIRLKVSLRMCGGVRHTITKLGYHLIATGRGVLPD